MQAPDADEHNNDDTTAMEIKVADLGEDARAEWLRSREYLKQEVGNYVPILALGEITNVTNNILHIAGG